MVRQLQTQDAKGGIIATEFAKSNATKRYAAADQKQLDAMYRPGVVYGAIISGNPSFSFPTVAFFKFVNGRSRLMAPK
jgi:hypothetical protein